MFNKKIHFPNSSKKSGRKFPATIFTYRNYKEWHKYLKENIKDCFLVEKAQGRHIKLLTSSKRLPTMVDCSFCISHTSLLNILLC